MTLALNVEDSAHSEIILLGVILKGLLGPPETAKTGSDQVTFHLIPVSLM